MTFDQMKTFLIVARLGGFRMASKELNISQPAISSRIIELEKSLGTQLFIRDKQGVRLTKAGILLKKHVTHIQLIIEKIKVEVSPSNHIDILLRIGVAETIAQSWLTRFLNDIHKKYPNINFELSVDLSKNLRSELLNRSIDMAILMGPVSEPSVENYPLPEVELVWFKPKSLKKIDLTKVPIITYKKDSRPRIELEHELLTRFGTDFQIYSSSSISAAFDMIASKLGIGLLPKSLGNHHVNNGQIEEFDMGWKPNPLTFTVSIISEPSNIIIKSIAKIAQQTALRHHKNFDTQR